MSDTLEVKDQTEVEAKTEEKEDLIVEKDGDIYLKVEAEEADTEEKENPDADPDEGQTDEDKSVISKKEGDEDDLEPAYEGKSKFDIIKMHQEAKKKISEQGIEVGKLREQTKDIKLTPEQMRKSLTADEINIGLKQERLKLNEIDPVLNSDEYSDQQEGVTQLETDWLEKRQDDLVQSKFNSKDNAEFKDTQKQRFKDSGVEITDDEFEDVATIAENYLEDGKYTDRSFQKGMIDKFGVERMTKFYKMAGEQKAREDIQKAESKTTVKVDVKGSGKNSKLVRLDSLSERELNKVLDNMSVEQLNELYERRNK